MLICAVLLSTPQDSCLGTVENSEQTRDTYINEDTERHISPNITNN